MTTIILTIIGILLAAAAALMVIFYGGDAFNSGSVGARANTLQNAGTNVISAVTLFKAEGAATPGTVSALSPNYLKEEPALDGIGTQVDAITGGLYTVTGVEDEVCARVNKNLGLAENATGKASKMGCDTTDNVFYAAV